MKLLVGFLFILQFAMQAAAISACDMAKTEEKAPSCHSQKSQPAPAQEAQESASECPICVSSTCFLVSDQDEIFQNSHNFQKVVALAAPPMNWVEVSSEQVIPFIYYKSFLRTVPNWQSLFSVYLN